MIECGSLIGYQVILIHDSNLRNLFIAFPQNIYAIERLV